MSNPPGGDFRGALHPFEIFLVALLGGAAYNSLPAFVLLLVAAALLSSTPRLVFVLALAISLFWGVLVGTTSHDIVYGYGVNHLGAGLIGIIFGFVVAHASMMKRTGWPISRALGLHLIWRLIIRAWRARRRQSAAAAASGFGPNDSTGCDEVRLEFDPYAVFSLPADAGPEELKRRYHELIKQYHPDQTAHLGPELRELANAKMVEINQAYEILAREMGGH